jgi:opacity protein-like surface antigen
MLAAFTGAVMLSIPRTADAQGRPTVELAGGYQYVISNDMFPRGLFASAAWNATGWLAIIGEFSQAKSTFVRTAETETVTLYSTLGGVRFRRGGFFAQVLVGQGASQSRRQILAGVQDKTETDYAIQPGAGVDFRVTRTISVRLEGSFLRRMASDARFPMQGRISTGVVVGLGSR